MLRGMSQCRCPVCGAETVEIRAKLVCRGCGMILETCCEGGPMGGPAAMPASPPESSPPDDSTDG
jgi:hypothetical protein